MVTISIVIFCACAIVYFIGIAKFDFEVMLFGFLGMLMSGSVYVTARLEEYLR